MFWKKQNHIDREILAEMMFTDYRELALEIFSTAHWEELPDASEKNSKNPVYGCNYGNTLILAKASGDLWEVKVCNWNKL